MSKHGHPQMTMLAAVAAAAAAVVTIATSASADPAKEKALVERGRYVVTVGNCNDCHTPMFAMKETKVDESEWLSGDTVGWRGPWGTTYPKNLRSLAQRLSEKEWVAYGRALKTRPPMPYWSVNTMSDDDLKAVYHFLKSLGGHPRVVPAALAPGETPTTPYIDFTPVVPTKS